MNNPGRYLALNHDHGASAASGSPYFTQQPGQKLYQWDTRSSAVHAQGLDYLVDGSDVSPFGVP